MDKRKLAAAARDGFGLERTKLSELIATFIQETVTSGKLKVGDRLPPERQLARDFKVNRATVREGMHLLWERGLVERKNRRGTRIVSMKPSTVGAAIERYFVLSNCRHRDLHEIRSVLEPKSAALAATNANEEDLNKLKELVKELDECWKLEGARQLASADVGFHLALASASHNALMIAIFSGLTPVLEKLLFIQHAEIRRPESFLMHREVYEAVADRDPARAAQVMARHMETTPIFGSKPSSSLHQHRAGLTASYTAAAEGS
jgi:GntR family transcriptional repressor for pyruvate dehydrogenase complex